MCLYLQVMWLTASLKKQNTMQKKLAGSKYDADAQAKCMNIVERSRRFLEKMKGN